MAVLAASVLCIAPAIIDSAQASGSDDLDDDWDEPDEPDEPDVDNSGPGGGDDFDEPDDNDNSGGGDDPDEPDDNDNSGHGSGDDGEPNDDGDNSGHGGGDDDEPDDDNSGSSGSGGHGGNSGPGSANSGHDDSQGSPSASASEETLYSVESDAQRGEYIAGEVIFVGTANDLGHALNLGFMEISAQNLLSGGTMARLSIPNGTNLDQAMVLLRDAAPNAIVTPNTIYRHAQSASTPAPRPRARRNSSSARLRGALGVIDTGVDASLLRADAMLSQQAFAGAYAVPREHGAMVASIAVSHGARVHIADVFGRSNDGALAASAERIAAAIDWMVANRIAVVNISVEGPNNAVLEEMVRRAAERGHIIVAAAGNGGPAARPTFPAAFDGVLAITAIDEAGRPYVRANRGAYVDFAAHGVNVRVDVGDTTSEVSGTSFAAPVIAAEAAAHLHAPSPTESARVVSRMRDRAEDLGAPGRDNIFGWGAFRD